jgi:YidC/Oxa1 family membrane protein insertase
MDQRRFLLALVLMFLLLFTYEQLFVRPYRRPPATPPETGQQPPAPTAEQPAPARESPPAAGATGLAAPVTDDTQTVTVDTDLVRATITTMGARLRSLELKNFRQTVAADSPPLDLVTASQVLPLTAELGNGTSDATVAYTASKTAVEVHGGDQAEIEFTGKQADGRAIEKRYRFAGNSYLFDLDINASGERNRLGLILTPISELGASGGRSSGRELAVALAGGKVIEKPVDKLAEATEVPAPVWAGFSAQYFAALAVPPEGDSTAWQAMSDNLPVTRLDVPAPEGKTHFALFFGPKDRDILTAAGHQLDRALDFGWFWFIALPLLWGLRFLHRFIPNYGVNIILLTALVKLATAPLTRTSFRNMKAMQKLQPEMQRLRERYKDDQGALQKEVMELYKRNHVNPLSGCLPMLLQLPIFVGLYNALMHAIELRHAPFVLWINDLAAPDRLQIPGVPIPGGGLPVLVIIMGLSMLLQQWMTPQQGDPNQQRMMMIMPVVFTFISINFPSGLVLYWLVNNILTMGQQWTMLRSADGGAGR